MKFTFLLCVLLYSSVSSCYSQTAKNYIIFLHNVFLENHSLEDTHPQYGRTEYLEIINAFKKEGFEVLSEKRKGDIKWKDYALKVVKQMDSLISQGVSPNRITVVGTSKGGYIAQYASTVARNPDLNFVFIGSYMDSDIQDMPEINFCGNILTIYEKTDPWGVSAVRRKETSKLKINHFKEIELNTGLEHGFLFKALDEWIVPVVKWAKQNYELR